VNNVGYAEENLHYEKLERKGRLDEDQENISRRMSGELSVCFTNYTVIAAV